MLWYKESTAAVQLIGSLSGHGNDALHGFTPKSQCLCACDQQIKSKVMQKQLSCAWPSSLTFSLAAYTALLQYSAVLSLENVVMMSIHAWWLKLFNQLSHSYLSFHTYMLQYISPSYSPMLLTHCCICLRLIICLFHSPATVICTCTLKYINTGGAHAHITKRTHSHHLHDEWWIPWHCTSPCSPHPVIPFAPNQLPLSIFTVICFCGFICCLRRTLVSHRQLN